MSLGAAVDAGTKAVAAAADAGVAAAAGLGSSGAPAIASATAGWWHTLLTAGAGFGAAITGVLVIFGWWVSRRLERFKHELAASLAKRQLRADYVRGQIDHLYGPLAFLVEASERHIDSHRSILRAYDGYFAGRGLTPGTEKEMTTTLDVANSYFVFVDENNQQAEKLLRAGWGWLDRDDVDIALHFIAEVARLRTEYKNNTIQIPGEMYIKGIHAGTLEPPSWLPPEFIERMRAKLSTKQRELAGLTGADGQHQVTLAAAEAALPPQDASPAPPAQLPR